MPDNRTSFSDRLLAVEPRSPDSREKLHKELEKMFIRELTTPRRMFFGLVSVGAWIGAAVCGLLALTESNLPPLARAGLATGTLFGLAWGVVAGRIVWKGTLDLRIDNRRLASMVWVFTVLMMVFFLMVGMSAADRQLGLMMIVTGLAFLIGAGVHWLTYRIEQAELDTRERLLQIELRFAEFCEKRS